MDIVERFYEGEEAKMLLEEARDEITRLRSDLALAQGQRDASEREAELLRDENAVLRWVYEAARRVLRFDGVDAGAVKIALIDMDMAIERVKLLDSGQWE